MARPPLVVDASVGVKWFSAKGEQDLVTANPRHQSKAVGCKVLPLEDYA